MIIRRRRTRIEIEHTTLRVETGGLYGAEVMSSARAGFEPSLGAALSLPTPEPNRSKANLPATTSPVNTPVKETRS
jgi:hypothetical protein